MAKVKVQLPDGRIVDGTEVTVDETTERWSEVKLADGSVVRVKLAILGAARADDEHDPNGLPIYSLQFAPIIVVGSAPDDLMRKPKAN